MRGGSELCIHRARKWSRGAGTNGDICSFSKLQAKLQAYARGCMPTFPASRPSYKPYGGGKAYCPGRFFAPQEIFGFVALLVHLFDIQLDSEWMKRVTRTGGSCFPEADDSLLTLGVSRLFQNRILGWFYHALHDAF